VLVSKIDKRRFNIISRKIVFLFFLLILLDTKKIDVHAGNNISVRLVHKVGESYYTVNTRGNTNPVDIRRDSQFYLLIPIDCELYQGSKLKLNIIRNGDTVTSRLADLRGDDTYYDHTTGKVENMYYDWKSYSLYFPVSSLLNKEQGTIKIDIEIILANGQIIMAGDAPTDVIFVNLLGEYTVNYNANGGYGAPTSQTKYNESILTLSDSKPSREGYAFLGWSTSSEVNNISYSAGGEYAENSDITLYAVWEKNMPSSGSSSESNPTNSSTGGSEEIKKKQNISTPSPSYIKAIGSKVFSLGVKADGDGKLTYDSSNKKVATVTSSGRVTVKAYGESTVTIKASETESYYSTIKKVTVKVVPKKALLKSAKSPSKKKMKISWKKDKTATGYEIYVSPKKDFSRETIERSYKKNTVSKTIVGWKSKKTYYVKIRAYKTIRKKKYYGAWSNVKKVKIR